MDGPVPEMVCLSALRISHCAATTNNDNELASSVLPSNRPTVGEASLSRWSDDHVSPSLNHPMSERETCYIVRRNLIILATEGGHSISLKCSAELFRVRNKARIVSLAPHTLSWGWKFGLDYEETSDRWKMF